MNLNYDNLRFSSKSSKGRLKIGGVTDKPEVYTTFLLKPISALVQSMFEFSSVS